jgi:uncharacterized protein
LLRALEDGFDPAVVADIDRRLADIVLREKVKVLWAIESGSRAWGFPSPDSDYDCRFVYLRSRESYLGLFQPRDVIETPLTPVLDVNGWDLQKAIKLLLKGNAVIIEWLTSGNVYRGDPEFQRDFLDLAGAVANRGRIANHYLHLAYSMRGRVFGEGHEPKLKKLFYVLRPAMALRWLRQRPGQTIAPMNFQELCAGADLPPELESVISDLIRRKAMTRELGSSPVPLWARGFIEDEISLAEQIFANPEPANGRQIALADAFFLRWLQNLERSDDPC